MGKRTIMFFVVSWLSSPGTGSACDLPASDDAKPWLGTNRPVLADNVIRSTGFGMHFHRLLQEHRMHTGVDWIAALGSPVTAAADGTVLEAGRHGYDGNMVLLDHGAGWRTLYGHLASFSVKPGDCVKFGTPIGQLGQSGLTSGPGLHFEVQHNGEAVNPLLVPARAPEGVGR
jgi:murein DD-endopeptidase MepM/ murein hydrolase activator NlpD